MYLGMTIIYYNIFCCVLSILCLIYLYLREQMAFRDKASQLRSAENIGIRKGELLKLVTLVQRKIEKGDTVDKIADDLLEDQEIIEKIYNLIRKYPDKDEKEICNFLI